MASDELARRSREDQDDKRERKLELPPRGMITLFRRPLILDELGLRIGKKRIAWDDVDFYTYSWEDGFLAGDMFIVTRDDRWMRIDDRYYYWRQAADRILAELHPRLRADPDHHPFELAGSELRHVRAGSLAVGDIDRVEIAPGPDGPALAVHTRHAPEAWSLDGLGKVHSVVLLLDTLVARGVAIRAAVPLWLPPSAGSLAEDVCGQVDLPPAQLLRR